MQIEECYRLMGADYDDVLSRMMTNQRVYKFNKKFSENSDLLASGENNLHESGGINQKKSKEKSHYQF